MDRATFNAMEEQSALLRDIRDRLPAAKDEPEQGASSPTVSQRRARGERFEPSLAPVPPRDRSHAVRTLDADASAQLDASVYRLGEAVTVEWPAGYTSADHERAEALLGQCSHVGTFRPAERKLDQALTDRLRAAGLDHVRVSSIDGAEPDLVWQRDPTPEQRAQAEGLLS